MLFLYLKYYGTGMQFSNLPEKQVKYVHNSVQIIWNIVWMFFISHGIEIKGAYQCLNTTEFISFIKQYIVGSHASLLYTVHCLLGFDMYIETSMV